MTAMNLYNYERFVVKKHQYVIASAIDSLPQQHLFCQVSRHNLPSRLLHSNSSLLYTPAIKPGMKLTEQIYHDQINDSL